MTEGDKTNTNITNFEFLYLNVKSNISFTY